MPSPMDARQFMQYFIKLVRQAMPNFTVWEVPAASHTPDRILVRFIEDRIMHNGSNATLGVQDMTDSTGTLYSVPSGYDQYWRDGLDNLYVGNWLANPDPAWTPLEPAQS